MSDSVIDIAAPLGGVTRRFGFQKQAPFTSYDSINFWPIDYETGRSVTATRPAMIAATNPGSSGTTACLARVNGVAALKPQQSAIASRGTQLYWWNGTTWTAATGAQANSISTSRQVMAHAFLEQAIIANGSSKPLVFDYPLGTCVTMVETAGTCPSGLSMFAVWQGAVVAAGDPTSPHVLYIARTGNMHDWNFAAPIEDTGGAFYTGGENAGLLRGPITAIMPLNTDIMVVSTVEGLVAFSGHPRRGGSVTDISGMRVLGPSAWCKGPDGSCFYLAPGGLMQISQSGVVSQVSQPKMPRAFYASFLRDDYLDPKICMAYEPLWNGIVITQRGSVQDAWFYDLNLGGFHQMTLAIYPHVVMEAPPADIISSAINPGVAYGRTDGIVGFSTSGTETFSASITIGPVPISPNLTKRSLITGIDMVAAGDATITVSVGADGADAINRFNNTGFGNYVTTMAAIKSNSRRFRPNLAGAAMSINLANTGAGHDSRLQFEQASVSLRPAGRNRGIRYELPGGVGP